jgi:hypothetical protein
MKDTQENKKKQIDMCWEEKENKEESTDQLISPYKYAEEAIFKNVMWVQDSTKQYYPYYTVDIDDKKYVFDVYRDFTVDSTGEIKVNEFMETIN